MPDPQVLQALAVALATAAIATAVYRRLVPHAPRIIGRYSGETAPRPAVVLTLCLAGLAVAAAAFWTTFTSPQAFSAPVVGAAAAVLALAAACTLHPDWMIRWSPEGIEGPVSPLPYPGAPDRASFAWDSITATGRDAAGGFFVQHWDGTRIRWGLTYGDHSHLMAAVARNCPHLFPEAQPET
jgi:hypothetical protein